MIEELQLGGFIIECANIWLRGTSPTAALRVRVARWPRVRCMGVGMSDQRWVEVEPSQFAHEREALDFARRRLPDAEPWRAWSNFAFIDTNGKPSEVDLLVVAPRGVYLIEIKSYPKGRLDAGSGTWVWHRPDGSRGTYDNPFQGADGKAKRLKSLLLQQKALRGGGPKNAKSFWVQALVFLSSPDLKVDLDPRLQGTVLGPDPQEDQPQVCQLDGLIAHLKELDAHRGPQVNKPLAAAITDAMQQADIRQSERYRTAGTYRLVESIDEGDSWVDFKATHRLSRVDRRIRLHVRSRAADDAEKAAVDRAVEREFRLLAQLRHPAIESPEDLVPNPQGLAQIFPYEPDAVRLDHWLDEQPDLDLTDRLALFRDVAEGIAYAHEHGLSHRSLSPRRVWIVDDRGTRRVRLRDWSTVARDPGATGTSVLTGADRTQHPTSFALLAGTEASAYVAPELRTVPDASGVSADVFSLGCLLHLLLSGRPPAEDGDELLEVLSQHGHVPLSAALDQAPPPLVDVVQFATDEDAGQRVDSVAELLAWLDTAIEEVDAQGEDVDLLQASKGAEVADHIVVGRIGAGSSAVVLLVEDTAGKREVWKVARDADHAERLRAEHAALATLRHKAFVEPFGLTEISGHTVLRMEAGQVRTGEGTVRSETLASRLQADGPPSIDLIQRWGADLLDALVVMENEGVDHRDLKPENLVFVPRYKNNAQHLAVIDFSLTSTSHDDLDAGTVGYLDPFLRERQPRRWDLAAERYAAAVVLAELVTGVRPSWGDGVDPVASGLEVPHVRTEGVDPAIADRVGPVLQRALHRDVDQRYGTAEELRRAWEQLFVDVDRTTTVPDGAPAIPVDELDLVHVTASTPIADLGLSLRLTGAIERLGVADAGGLARVPANDLNRVGSGAVVRRELRQLRRRLREAGLAEEPEQIDALDDADLQRLSVDRLADRLVPPSNLSEQRVRRLKVLLGLDISAMDGRWPTLTATAATCDDTTAEIVDELDRARRRWADHRPELTVIRAELADWLTGQEGVATGDEVAQLLLARRGSAVDDPTVRLRRARAVVRAAVEAESAIGTPRFRDVRVGDQLFVALDVDLEVEGRGRIAWEAGPLVDVAVALGERADQLVAEAAVVNPAAANGALAAVEVTDLPAGVSFDETRPLRLAAASSTAAAVSSRGELYRTDLSAVDAARAARLTLMNRWGLTATQVQERVAARFPAAKPLPGRPDLDRVLEDAETGVRWDADAQRYAIEDSSGAHTTGWAPASTTKYGSTSQAELDVDEVERSLRRLEREGGFVAATVDGRKLRAAAQRLATRLGAPLIDLDSQLIAAMRQVADEVNADWPFVVDADAAEPNSQVFSRLKLFVERAIPQVEEQLRDVGALAVVTGVGLLARYQQMSLLDRLRDDLTHSEADPSGQLRGLLVVIPDSGTDTEHPEVDGVPIPVISAGQTIHIATVWLERGTAA